MSFLAPRVLAPTVAIVAAAAIGAGIWGVSAHGGDEAAGGAGRARQAISHDATATTIDKAQAGASTTPGASNQTGAVGAAAAGSAGAGSTANGAAGTGSVVAGGAAGGGSTGGSTSSEGSSTSKPGTPGGSGAASNPCGAVAGKITAAQAQMNSVMYSPPSSRAAALSKVADASSQVRAARNEATDPTLRSMLDGLSGNLAGLSSAIAAKPGNKAAVYDAASSVISSSQSVRAYCG